MNGFLTGAARRWFEHRYAEAAARWPIPCEELEVATEFGPTRVRSCGSADGSPLILLPGANGTSLSYAATVAELGARHRIHVLDPIGELGMSRQTAPMPDVSSTVRWFAETLETLGIERADLAGTSRGGWIAAAFAVRYPERVRSLTLLDSPVFAPLGARFYTWLLGMLPFAFLPEPIRGRIGPLREPDPGFSFVLRANTVFLPGACAPVPFTDEELRAITVPSRVVIAEHSALCPATLAHERATLIPDCQVEVLPGRDHFFPLREPDLVAAQILTRTA
ncbi:alpha/beta fold hydrolase [Sciscionella marina]|uniref:alpha/beta fold hydrolase n=1 Tax=Sciscionella marina TaxID=508770 RepID=UPI00035D08E4|nr:alpha/beta hydrolase [Sciscionella marina]